MRAGLWKSLLNATVAAGPPVDPALALSGLVLRQEVSPATTFSDAGSTHCTVGDTCRQWNDQSPSSDHASQSTAGDRPILRQTGRGIYYLEMNSSDGIVAPLLSLPGACTMCFATAQTLGGGSTRVVQSVSVNALVSPRRPSVSFYVGDNIKSAIGVDDSEARVYTIGKPAGGNWWLRINGVDQTGLSAVSTAWGTGFAWGTGGYAGSGEGFLGRAYGALAYTAEYTGANRTLIEEYVLRMLGADLTATVYTSNDSYSPGTSGLFRIVVTRGGMAHGGDFVLDGEIIYELSPSNGDVGDGVGGSLLTVDSGGSATINTGVNQYSASSSGTTISIRRIS